MNRPFLLAVAASFVGIAATAAPAWAQDSNYDRVIRPSKMLSVESASTLPADANLVSISGSDLEYYRGLTDRLQIEVGTGGLSYGSAANLNFRAQAKYDLWEMGPVGVGGGIGATTSLIGAAVPNYGGSVFAPVSVALLPGLGLNVVPRYALDTVAHAGIEVGMAYAVLPDVVAIAEDHVEDLAHVQHDLLVGGAYTGFGPRTTLACGLISGNGSPEHPYGLGLGATLHHGF